MKVTRQLCHQHNLLSQKLFLNFISIPSIYCKVVNVIHTSVHVKNEKWTKILNYHDLNKKIRGFHFS